MVRYPGHYRLGKVILGAFFGVTPQQRVEPLADFLAHDPKGQVVARAAVGAGAMSLAGLAVAGLLRLRK